MLAIGSTYRSSGIQLWDLQLGNLLATYNGRSGDVQALAFSPDGKLLASGGSDTTVLLWDISRARVQHLVSLLASSDVETAENVKKLPRDAVEVVEFLDAKLRKIAKLEAATWKWIAQLDHDEFDVRENASAELEKLDRDAEYALRLAAEGGASTEASDRIHVLLELIRQSPARDQKWSYKSILAAIALLEEIGTDKAKEPLREFAKGPENSLLTREASNSLRRLDDFNRK
jgi:hypothetical protein